MEALPIREAAFDRVVLRSALHHAGDEERVLSDIFRILKPGGRLAVAEPVNDNPLFRLARWKARHGKSYGKIHTIGKAFMTPELKAMLRHAGFVIDREVRYGFLAYPLCDNPDLVPLLKHCPFSRQAAAALRALDRFMAKLPLIKKGSWYAILSARRPSGDGDRR
jgi:SAM-dependent methyltransferase